eukprot:c34238_g1_i1.p1 GENE.c34238_g1_i1~~c34238_g1_i1.p1  ORF type:complete len:391 (+),score=60.04 c34238_g1_i1:73-1173(+)
MSKSKPPRLALGIVPPTTAPAEQPFTISPTGTFHDRQNALSISKTGFQIGAHAPAASLVSRDDVELVEEIGKGGAGVVYKAIDKRSGGLLAVKVIRLEVDDTTRKRIVTELKTLSDATSPCIVAFSGAWFDAGAISIAMEFMDCGSMHDVGTLAGPVPERILARVTYAVLSALDYLKSVLNIMHRDIKPANILVSRAGEIKVCDLGVSGSLNNSVAMSYVGTTSYMAPERINSSLGEGDDAAGGYDITADVFSLGLSVVELAFGRYPFPIAPFGVKVAPAPMGYWALLDVIMNQPSPTLSAEHFSAAACDFVDVCLRKKPRERAAPSVLLLHEFVRGCEADDGGATAAWLCELFDRRGEGGDSAEA